MLVADLRNDHELDKIETQSPSQLRATATETPLFVYSHETCKRKCCICTVLRDGECETDTSIGSQSFLRSLKITPILSPSAYQGLDLLLAFSNSAVAKRPKESRKRTSATPEDSWLYDSAEEKWRSWTVYSATDAGSSS
ncbi:hypothetical protein SNK03_008461 [Fusarium graminearum]|uniref:Chromosome 4, complete genome n=1 Tax=Gibberella zeae (strain ATCC MYA-4620 / CBS 123657 / FGSC 9075 / NRRL 31084 / PH-1) TaxID=229533 RepID=I1S885_GIBZE|nr:hypothetical protein FGSG_13063 [Fusarium graminearum PH-1]ESU13317.1 hypothetical protein FGSG_13063 [Fusarium graminearum PH-1]CEF83920.1 unnamed protein product [Fusarium graminearum]CZS72916.1 unnamed protein product [Fusarium graminearum]|eukprot:XP_011326824.1 hypothetical protein FGSG_13063 [Fusarium graminearum PH-1]